MELGVNTHFSQHWNTTLVDVASDIGAAVIRDSQPWGAVETSPGVYAFPDYLTSYMDRAQSDGVGALLTFSSVNALYDSGLTPYTAEGRQAYANYILAVLDRYGGEVKQIEVWNEFNTTSYSGPAAADKAASYTALLQTVYQTVKAAHPDVQILGGSVYTVATGFLEKMFADGALAYMDGLAVHPYQPDPNQIGEELGHLNDVMAKYGAVKPIYATEFGNAFSDPADAPAYLIKAVTEMAAAHVVQADWYALMDERWYSNMGLYSQTGAAKPAAAAFTLANSTLLPLGDPVRVETGDNRTVVYKYGADTFVMWGDERSVSFTGATSFKDSMGQTVGAPTSLSENPLIVSGHNVTFTFGTSNVVADSLYDYGDGVFSYFAKGANGSLTALTNVDWDWVSYYGSRYTKPLRINSDSIAPAGNGSNPIQAVERYTSDVAQSLEVTGHWTTGDGDGIDLHVLVNGKEIFSKVFVGTFDLSGLYVNLAAGDHLDIAVGPNQTVTGDSTKYRIQLLRHDQQVAAETTRDVFLTNITGRSYVAEHDVYSQTNVLLSAVRTHADGSNDYVFSFDPVTGVKTVDLFDAAGTRLSHTVTNRDGSTDVFTYVRGVLVKESVTHADKSKDVYLSNITGKTYVAEHDVYSSKGVMLQQLRTHADGSMDYAYGVDPVTGTKTTDRYDSHGALLSHTVVNADKSSDALTYIGGRLVKETVTHADKSKDIYLSNVTGKTYVAEHDVYSSKGVILEQLRTHADGSTDYFYGLDLTTGAKTTDRYDSHGALLSHNVLNTDKSSDAVTYSAGLVVKEVVTHADKSKDVYLSNITGKNYASEHDVYSSKGVMLEQLRTHADGSMDYAYRFDPSTGAKTTDQYDSHGTLMSHSIVFADKTSDVFVYNDGVLSRETLTHADKSKDVYLSNLTGKDYVAEHDVYSSKGALLSAIRTYADGSIDYAHSFFGNSSSDAAHQASASAFAAAQHMDTLF